MGRYQLLKLQKYNSTRPERIIGEILKSNRIRFKTKVVIANREVDFLIQGIFALEIGNHKQDSSKNIMLLEKGYKLMQLSNKEIYQQDRLKLNKFLLNWLKIRE